MVAMPSRKSGFNFRETFHVRPPIFEGYVRTLVFKLSVTVLGCLPLTCILILNLNWRIWVIWCGAEFWMYDMFGGMWNGLHCSSDCGGITCIVVRLPVYRLLLWLWHNNPGSGIWHLASGLSSTNERYDIESAVVV